MARKLSFGLIGAGGIAQAYAQAISKVSQAEIVGVADTRRDAAAALAEGIGATAHGDHQALAEACELDAVIVCTPPSTHPEISLYFLERGTHVLCEKPLAIDSASAEKMFAAAKSHDAILTMASKFRFVDDVIRGRSMVTSGALGEILLFENAFTGVVDMKNRWNSKPEISGGGVLIDNGTHSLDLLRYFLGPIAEVQVVEGKRIQGLAVEDTVRIFARSQSGVIASVDLSWSVNKELDSFIDVFGTEGAIRIGWGESKYRRTADRDWVVLGSGYDKLRAFQRQLENFANAIHGVEPLTIQPTDALASVRVVEAAYQSLHSNNWVPVPIEVHGEFESRA